MSFKGLRTKRIEIAIGRINKVIKFMVNEDSPTSMLNIKDGTGLEYDETRCIVYWLENLEILRGFKKGRRMLYVPTTRFPEKMRRYFEKGIKLVDKEEDEIMIDKLMEKENEDKTKM